MNPTGQQTPALPRLTLGSTEHIVISPDDTALCGSDTCECETRLVADDADPLSESSLNLCPDCADEWYGIHDTIEREPTVQCECMRRHDSNFCECGSIVPAFDARPMKHADADGLIPVCRECYAWLESKTQSNLTMSFDDAQSWLEMVENSRPESAPNSE
jgi:hypothetical protein